MQGLNSLPGLDVKAPDGAMYVFFRLPGASDSLALCVRLCAKRDWVWRPVAHLATKARVLCDGATQASGLCWTKG